MNKNEKRKVKNIVHCFSKLYTFHFIQTHTTIHEYIWHKSKPLLVGANKGFDYTPQYFSPQPAISSVQKIVIGQYFFSKKAKTAKAAHFVLFFGMALTLLRESVFKAEKYSIQ